MFTNLLYCLEFFPLTKTDLKSLDFVIDRFFMKLFRTSNIDTVKTCQLQFAFDLPSVIIEKRAKNLKIVLLKLTTRILTKFQVFGVAGIYTVIYLYGLDRISCIYRCFVVLICKPKLLAV